MSAQDESTAAALARSEVEVRQLLDRRDHFRMELHAIEAQLTQIAEWRAALLEAPPREESRNPTHPGESTMKEKSVEEIKRDVMRLATSRIRRDVWIAVYAAAYVRAAGIASLDRADIAKPCHLEALGAANLASQYFPADMSADDLPVALGPYLAAILNP